MDSLLVERADGVVTCTLNRPDKKNAITGEMWSGLIELFEVVATNPDDRVLVITGAGDGFCSGADLADGGTAEAGGGAGGARGLQPCTRLRPDHRVGTGALQRDLLEARPRRGLRRLVGPAAPRRHAPRQGARPARRRDRRN